MSTERQSIFNQAFGALYPENPEIGRQLPPKRVVKELSKLVEKEFGFSYVIVGENNTQKGTEALLDAYRNLQYMNNVLGINNAAIGLPNLKSKTSTLGLALPARAAGYLGAYFPQGTMTARQTSSDLGQPMPGRGIAMPGRSNSFAHEWGHALDYWMMDNFSADSPVTGRGIVTRIKNRNNKEMAEDATYIPESLEEAVADLIYKMFYEDSVVAVEILKVQSEIAKLKSNAKDPAKPPKRIVELEQQIERLKKGSTSKKLPKSQYRKTTELFSKQDYWVDPAEMMARAFEAYIAHKVSLVEDGSNEFITKGDYAYLLSKEEGKGADNRLAKTFPKGAERDAIFLAYDNLFNQLRVDQRLATDNVAKLPSNVLTDDKKAKIKAEREGFKDAPSEGWIKPSEIIPQQMAHLKKVKELSKRKEARPVNHGDRKFFERKRIAVTDNFFAPYIYTKKGTILALADRYKNQPKASAVIEEIISLTMTDMGGNRKTAKGGTFEENAGIKTRVWADKFFTIVTNRKLSDLQENQLKDLRLLMTSDPKTIKNYYQIPNNLKNAAYEIRTEVLLPMLTYLQDAGVNINLFPDAGFLPRMLDVVAVFADEQNFLYGKISTSNDKRGAIPLFRDVIFEQEYGSDTETDIDVMSKAVKKGLSKKVSKYLSEGTIQDLKDFKTLAEEQSDLKKAEDKDNSDAIDDIQGQLEELYTELHPKIAEAFGQAGGRDWLTRLNVQDVSDFTSIGVQGSFSKKRKLPAEADTYMVDYYLDPLEAMMQYIPQAVRHAEFNRRFGEQRVPKGYRKRSVATDDFQSGSRRNYLDYLFEIKLGDEARGEITKDDIRQLRLDVNFLLNINQNFKDSALKNGLANLHLIGTMSLLPRATIAGIAEPVTVGVQTGQPLTDGIKNIFGTVQELTLTKKGKELVLHKRQLARILGVVDNPEIGEIVANRLGGNFADNPKLAARAGRYFVRTMLTGVTNAQRRSSMRIGFQFFAEISNEYRNPLNPTMKKRARDILTNDYGVDPGDLDQFTEYMTKSLNDDFNMPNAEDFVRQDGNMNLLGEMIQIAIVRFVDSTIQDPKVADKPRYAEHPVGRIVYGIQSFSRSFTRNVLIYSYKKMNREFGYVKEARTANEISKLKAATQRASIAAQALSPLFAIYLGHTIVSTIREALMNPDRWEEEDKNGTLTQYLLEMGITRSGMTGGLDPFYNAWRSLRYSRDLANMLVGAAPSYMLQSTGKIAKSFQNNSPNTVSAEYQRMKGIYELILVPMIVLGASSEKIAPILGKAAGLSAAVFTSPGFQHWVTRNIIKEFTGVEYYPGSGAKKSDSNELPF